MAERETLRAVVPFDQQFELDGVPARAAARRRRVGAPDQDPG